MVENEPAALDVVDEEELDPEVPFPLEPPLAAVVVVAVLLLASAGAANNAQADTNVRNMIVVQRKRNYRYWDISHSDMHSALERAARTQRCNNLVA
jgi:hypothetical protein